MESQSRRLTLAEIAAKRAEEDIDEVYPRVYMSGHSSAKHLQVLQSRNITHVVCVTAYARPHWEKEGIKYLIIEDVEDSNYADIAQHFEQTNQFISSALASAATNSVLVHCSAGVSRSGSICMAYMLSSQKWPSFETAFEHARSRRSKFYPNSHFQDQLKAYASSIESIEDVAAEK